MSGYPSIFSGAGAGAELSGGTVMLGEYAPVKRVDWFHLLLVWVRTAEHYWLPGLAHRPANGQG